MDGRDFGAHRGFEAYTIGQRRGLDIPYGTRIYVTAKRGADVIIGPGDALFSRRVQIRDVNFIPFDTLTGEMRAQAKLRYTPKTAACTVRPTQYGAELLFDNVEDPLQMHDLSLDPAHFEKKVELRNEMYAEMNRIGDRFHTSTYYRDNWTKDRIILKTKAD